MGTTLGSTPAGRIAGPILGLMILSFRIVGVKLQPAPARGAERMSKGADSPIPVVQGADRL